MVVKIFQSNVRSKMFNNLAANSTLIAHCSLAVLFVVARNLLLLEICCCSEPLLFIYRYMSRRLGCELLEEIVIVIEMDIKIKIKMDSLDDYGDDGEVNGDEDVKVQYLLTSLHPALYGGSLKVFVVVI